MPLRTSLKRYWDVIWRHLAYLRYCITQWEVKCLLTSFVAYNVIMVDLFFDLKLEVICIMHYLWFLPALSLLCVKKFSGSATMLEAPPGSREDLVEAARTPCTPTGRWRRRFIIKFEGSFGNSRNLLVRVNTLRYGSASSKIDGHGLTPLYIVDSRDYMK